MQGPRTEHAGSEKRPAQPPTSDQEFYPALQAQAPYEKHSGSTGRDPLQTESNMQGPRIEHAGSEKRPAQPPTLDQEFYKALQGQAPYELFRSTGWTSTA
jgi:hypothetical protein